MSAYPDYVHKTLARAREEGQWQAGQADAAALCFDVLALFPDCDEAKGTRLRVILWRVDDRQPCCYSTKH